jgi:Beta-propeller repeat
MRKFYTLLISAGILSFLSFEAIAQEPAPEWTKLYAGPTGSGATARDIKVINEFVYVSGASNGSPLVLKYDARNPTTPPMIMTYPSAGGTQDFEVDADGNVYVLSRTELISKRNSIKYPDYLTIKFNADGSLAWAKTYAGPAGGYDIPQGITVDNNGNVYITGAVDSKTSSSGHAIVTIKYSASGEQKWIARLDELPNVDGTEVFEKGSAIVLDQFGDVYITGRLGTSMFVAKYQGDYTGPGLNPWIWRDYVVEGTEGRSIGIVNGNVIASGWEGAIVSYSLDGTRN